MHTLSLVASLATSLAAVNAQVTYTNGTFQCLGPAAGKNFCAGDSLQTNIIIRCTGTRGQPGNCNDNLAGVPPVGVKTFAPCFQTSNTTGDAACSYNGVAYPSDGRAPFNVTDGSAISSSSSSIAASSTTTTASATSAVASTTESESTTTATASETTATESATVTQSESGSATETVTNVVVVTPIPSTTGTTATGSMSSPSLTPFTGAGSHMGVVGGFVVGVAGAVAAML